jgi:NADH-quinone oxidoreductase subunit J
MNALFIVFAAMAIGSALVVVTASDPIQAVMALIITFFALAGIFVLLDAHFLAAAQIIVYAGAILVLITFVIMLLDLRAGDIRTPTSNIAGRFLGVAAAIATFAFTGSKILALKMDAFPEAAEGHGTVEAVARTIIVDFSLPFEVASVLLLVATIGAVWIARREDT